MHDLPTRISNLHSDLMDIPQVKRGKVFCHECGRVASIQGNPFRTGWEKCCGYTMSLDSPEERAAFKAGAADYDSVRK